MRESSRIWGVQDGRAHHLLGAYREICLPRGGRGKPLNSYWLPNFEKHTKQPYVLNFGLSPQKTTLFVEVYLKLLEPQEIILVL